MPIVILAGRQRCVKAETSVGFRARGGGTAPFPGTIKVLESIHTIMVRSGRLWEIVLIFVMASGSFAQSEGQAPPPARPASTVPSASDGAQSDASTQTLPDAPTTQQGTTDFRRQPKRILGIMPNYRAVSAGAIPPPPTPRQAFKIATQNSFDYSAFLFVGITSLMAEGSNAHPQLGKGIAGYGRYYWRGFVDKTDGNYLVIFALPTVFHEDERYYAMGTGGIWKRAIYSASRILITPDYHGHNTFNASEVLGRGISQSVSLAYYPSQDRTASALAAKYGYAMARDALTNVFREFWPDIATHVLHRHSSSGNDGR